MPLAIWSRSLAWILKLLMTSVVMSAAVERSAPLAAAVSMEVLSAPLRICSAERPFLASISIASADSFALNCVERVYTLFVVILVLIVAAVVIDGLISDEPVDQGPPQIGTDVETGAASQPSIGN